MTLHYFYQEEAFHITVKWTDAFGKSVVHQEAVCRLLQRHGAVFQSFLEPARLLDEKVDKLYEVIYTYLEEYKSSAYNPAHRRLLLEAYGEIVDCLDRNVLAAAGEAGSAMAQLCQQILDQLRALLEVYLEDHAYRSKYRSRRRNYEEAVEDIGDISDPQDFESVLLQMTDLARLLDQLTEPQKVRLVKHIFLGYTLQEIADQEGVSNQSVSASIAAALKKLRTLMEGSM